jgi:hypothetical protein
MITYFLHSSLVAVIRAGRLGVFFIFMVRSSMLCRSGACSGWPGDLLGVDSGPGEGGSEGARGAPNPIQMYVFIAIQTSVRHVFTADFRGRTSRATAGGLGVWGDGGLDGRQLPRRGRKKSV